MFVDDFTDVLDEQEHLATIQKSSRKEDWNLQNTHLPIKMIYQSDVCLTAMILQLFL